MKPSSHLLVRVPIIIAITIAIAITTVIVIVITIATVNDNLEAVSKFLSYQ